MEARRSLVCISVAVGAARGRIFAKTIDACERTLRTSFGRGFYSPEDRERKSQLRHFLSDGAPIVARAQLVGYGDTHDAVHVEFERDDEDGVLEGCTLLSLDCIDRALQTEEHAVCESFSVQVVDRATFCDLTMDAAAIEVGIQAWLDRIFPERFFPVIRIITWPRDEDHGSCDDDGEVAAPEELWVHAQAADTEAWNGPFACKSDAMLDGVETYAHNVESFVIARAQWNDPSQHVTAESYMGALFDTLLEAIEDEHGESAALGVASATLASGGQAELAHLLSKWSRKYLTKLFFNVRLNTCETISRAEAPTRLTRSTSNA